MTQGHDLRMLVRIEGHAQPGIDATQLPIRVAPLLLEFRLGPGPVLISKAVLFRQLPDRAQPPP